MKPTMIPYAVCAALVLFGMGCSEDSSHMMAPGQEVGSPTRFTASQEWQEAGNSLDQGQIVQQEVQGSEVMESRHSGLLALSLEEAAWLDRHGYPTPEELDALSTYDVEALESSLRNQKELKAAALLGHRRMLDGDMDGAWAAFAAGASLGSLYARQQMALVSWQRAASMSGHEDALSDPANQGTMIAQLEVTRMLGDHRAQSLIDKYSADFNWKYYGRNVLNQTAIFMDQYGLHARSTGRRAVGPDPRPNAFEWQQLEKDPGARVTLYTRSRANP